MVEIIRETVNESRRKEIYELGIGKDFKSVSIYIMTPESPVLTIHGNDPVEKYLKVDKIPSGLNIVRIESNINSGVVLTDKNTTAVRIFAPVGDIIYIRRNFPRIALDVLESHGIEAKVSTHRPAANDLVFVKNGIEKKFCGCAVDPIHGFFSFFFCFDFNHSLAKDLYKIDTEKMKRRGDISSISDIVGGLREVSPNSGPHIIEEIIERIILELKPSWNEGIK